MSLYTKTGDAGQTELASRQRISKSHPQVEAYGTVDELSAHIGLLVALLRTPNTNLGNHVEPQIGVLVQVQHDLFAIGGIVAGAQLSQPDHTHLERAIDQIEQPWRGFSLPGGSVAASQAHVCRTVCRRAERQLVAQGIDNVYLNRLSDFLYALALRINQLEGVDEVFWHK